MKIPPKILVIWVETRERPHQPLCSLHAAQLRAISLTFLTPAHNRRALVENTEERRHERLWRTSPSLHLWSLLLLMLLLLLLLLLPRRLSGRINY